MAVMGERDEKAPGLRLGAIDEDHLFASALVSSQAPSRTRFQRVAGRVSLIAHVTVLAAIVLVPIFMPEELPEQGDRRVVFFDPPPPPPPPMQRGSSAPTSGPTISDEDSVTGFCE